MAGGLIAGVIFFYRQRAAVATVEQRLCGLPVLEERLAEAASRVEALQNDKLELSSRGASLEARLENERRTSAEKVALLADAQAKLSDAFNGLCSDALRKNNQSFLELARATLEKFQEGAKHDLEKRHLAIGELVAPVRASLDKVDGKIQELEQARAGAYESLTQQVRALIETQALLRSETSNLVHALRSPIVRGRWGEIQLRRVVEMAGMLGHCDFYEQESVTTADGRLRPDLLVRLPGGKNIIVDAKAPLNAYLDAVETKDEKVRLEKLTLHAAQIRAHIGTLTAKSYWNQFQPAPEFAVLFLPGEMFFSAALERDPSLIEFGADRHVILATPTTLIALLKAIFYGWRQEKLAKNAQEISQLGRELHERLAKVGDHWAEVGHGLDGAVQSYNKAVRSLESRVFVTARRFKDLEASQPNVEIAPLEPVEEMARQLQAPELLRGEDLSDGRSNESR